MNRVWKLRGVNTLIRPLDIHITTLVSESKMVTGSRSEERKEIAGGRFQHYNIRLLKAENIWPLKVKKAANTFSSGSKARRGKSRR